VTRSLAALLALVLARPAGAGLPDDPWRVPPPGACTSEAPRLLNPPAAKDAPPVTPPMPGDSIGAENAERLRDFVPPEIWEKRERFFYEGMHMEIGPCYRDYSPPEFFQKVTRELHGAVTLEPDGTLSGYRAGVPFPPDTIAPDDPRAAQKWAWNAVSSYGAAGSFSTNQISIVNDKGVAEQWQGEYFYLQVRGRADQAAHDYRYPAETAAGWVSGGVTRNVKTGNECAFRQYQTGGRVPETFVGTSYSRRVTRYTSPDSETAWGGCLIDATIGAGLFLHGFEPHLHDWKIRGVVDLLAPINSSKPNWPADKNRNYGPWGISFADDRWELRRVIVLDGTLREGKFEDGIQRFVWYVDLQTLQLLYYAGYKANGDAQGVGYWVRRWSEDRPDYPKWEDDPNRPVRTLDVVGSAFVDWGSQHAVRHDSGDAVSIPKSDAKLRRSISIGSARVH
jgi:hypothetical protein